MDLLKEIKKLKRSSRIKLNQIQGAVGEKIVEGDYLASEHEVVRKPFGQDFEVKKVNAITGRKGKVKKIEVKTGKAQTSKLQKKTQKKSKGYKVVRPPFSI